MPDVTIRMRPNGPLVIGGPFKLIDSRGAEFEIPADKPAPPTILPCPECGGSPVLVFDLVRVETWGHVRKG